MKLRASLLIARILLRRILLWLQASEPFYVPAHAVNGIAMRLDASDLILNCPRLVDIKRRRRVVNVEHPGRLLAAVAKDGHRKLSLGDVFVQPRRVVVQADQDELHSRHALVLLVSLLDERQLRPAGPSPG